MTRSVRGNTSPDFGWEFVDGRNPDPKGPARLGKSQVNPRLRPFIRRNDATNVCRYGGWLAGQPGRLHTIDQRTESHTGGDIPLGLQTLQNADDCAPGELILAGEISGRRQSGTWREPAVKNGRAQFAVQPIGQGLMARPAFKSELERADGLWHLKWSNIIRENGSVR